MKPYTPKDAEAAAKRLTVVLREAIQKSGVSQQQIARDTGIKQPALSKFVNGGSLKLETVAALIDYFGLEVGPSRPTKRRA